MLVVLSKEDTIDFLEKQVQLWRGVCYKPNLNAFEFDPKTVDPKKLVEDGYYDDRTSWLAGVALNALGDKLEEVKNSPTFNNKKI